MTTPRPPRPAAALLRHAARRWPDELRDRLLREWQAELAVVAASGGARWWRGLRALRFAASLAVRRPEPAALPLPAPRLPRPGREMFGATLLVALLGTLAALSVVHLPGAVADRLPGATGPGPAHRWPLLLLVPALLAVGALSGRWLARRDGPRGATRTVLAVVPGLAVVLVGGLGGPGSALPALAVWTAGMLGAGHLTTRLARRGPLPRAALLLGSVLPAYLAVTSGAWLALDATEAPRAYAAAWFPAVLLEPAVALPLGPGAQFAVLDEIELMPHCLLVTGAFLLAYLHRVSARAAA